LRDRIADLEQYHRAAVSPAIARYWADEIAATRRALETIETLTAYTQADQDQRRRS
jgi:hypothetical protein